MKESYDVKYRQPGQLFWRTLKNVTGDMVESNCRWFMQDDDTMTFVSVDAEVRMSPHRAAVRLHRMSKEAGQPIQRA